MMKIQPCKNICHECGFIKNTPFKGALTNGLIGVYESGMIFPCHLHLKAVTGSENEGVEEYIEVHPEINVCRGYVTSVYKTHIEKMTDKKIPNQFANKVWGILFDQVYMDDLDRVMTIDEAIKYHGVKNGCD